MLPVMEQPKVPTLLPLARSRAQLDLLALLYLHPEQWLTLSEIGRRIHTSTKTVHLEANRLVEAGLLEERREGRNRLLRAAGDTYLTRPLTDLLAVTHGPLPVLTDALADLPGVEHAFIFGSWAARYHGEPGPPPGDIDLLVVGTVDLDDLEERLTTARQVLRREINARRVSPEHWTTPPSDDVMLTSIQSRPLVALGTDAR